jgi:hypothetical protein
LQEDTYTGFGSALKLMCPKRSSSILESYKFALFTPPVQPPPNHKVTMARSFTKNFLLEFASAKDGGHKGREASFFGLRGTKDTMTRREKELPEF